jgi:hypothetical protein
MKFTTRLLRDGDNLIIPLPPEFVQDNGIEEGDDVSWSINKEGGVVLHFEKLRDAKLSIEG